MGKSIHFSGQPLYSQVIKLLDKSKILQISRKYGGEHYVKRFDGWTHLVVMLYAIIMRFDSLREIMASIQAEARKLCHLGITTMPSRSTLSDANKRRPEIIFESIYRDLYTTYRNVLSSDSRKNRDTAWMKHLQIIDSTTITLFSNLLFKGVGHHPKTGKKKGGIKVHTVIHANEGVPSDIKFTSAATNDSFMLRPSALNKGDIITMDRAYIDYEKLETLTQREVLYVTKMKKNLKYNIIEDCMYQTDKGLMEVRIQNVTFSKMLKDGTIMIHHARIITYVDIKKHKLVSLLTNDMESDPNEIIEIYRKRWEIELLFKQIKQNFPLKYFYGESANAIKIQIWVTLIANLLLMVMKKGLTRSWSFSGLATMMRITLMYYVDFYSLFNHPEKDWETLLDVNQKEDCQLSIF
ncbi:IS4 family transposase [Bacteroides caecigallinarum]|uniref:IS4 family transposase n=1 Tax=Bacteroides caecigallinarum TaxID=1411144 RepID=UPI0019595D5E|nr:IS4 family transposase [Bacteroides caecigallinarum]MBM6891417.1 IS4 family transposase [Bacteroides caecigallinarum]